jgi:hypothetical protein
MYPGEDALRNQPQLDDRGMIVGSKEQRQYERALRSPYRQPPGINRAEYRQAREVAYANSPFANIGAAPGEDFPLPGSWSGDSLQAASTHFMTPRRPESLPGRGFLKEDVLDSAFAYSGAGGPERLALTGSKLYSDAIVPPVRESAGDRAIAQLRAEQAQSAIDVENARKAARGYGVDRDPSIMGRLTQQYAMGTKPIPVDPSIRGRNAAARIEFRDLPMAGPNAPVARNDMSTRYARATAVPLPRSLSPLETAGVSGGPAIPKPRLRPSEGRGEASPAGGRTIRIGEGQTLGEIAKRYGVSVSSLAKANGIANVNRVRAGQQLVIPTTQPQRREKKRKATR